MAGQLTLSTLSDGTNSTSVTNAIQGSAKAWLNYNAVAQSIRGSYNISSVVVNSAGDISIFFTNNMPDTNYAWSISQQLNGTGNNDTGAASTGRNFGTSSWGTNFMRINVMSNTNASQESPLVLTVAVFR